MGIGSKLRTIFEQYALRRIGSDGKIVLLFFWVPKFYHARNNGRRQTWYIAGKLSVNEHMTLFELFRSQRFACPFAFAFRSCTSSLRHRR